MEGRYGSGSDATASRIFSFCHFFESGGERSSFMSSCAATDRFRSLEVLSSHFLVIQNLNLFEAIFIWCIDRIDWIGTNRIVHNQQQGDELTGGGRWIAHCSLRMRRQVHACEAACCIIVGCRFFRSCRRT